MRARIGRRAMEEHPEDLQRIRLGGVRAYVSKDKLVEIFNRFLRSQVEKRYEVHERDDKDKDIASVMVGLRETDIVFDANFSTFHVEKEGSKDMLRFAIENQLIVGQIKLHLQKKAELGFSSAEIINKTYNIKFNFRLKKLVVGVKLTPGPEGFPLADIQVSLEQLELSKNLDYQILNPDLLTNVVSMTKGLWLSEVESALKKKLLPQLNSTISKVVNDGIRKFYLKEFKYEKENITLTVDLQTEGFEVNTDFLVVTLNGFVSNPKKPKKMYSILSQGSGYKIPDLSRIIGSDHAYVQVSDDVIHSGLAAYFLNELSWESAFKEAGCKSMVISHTASEPIKIEIKREDDCYGAELVMTVQSRFLIKVKHTILPDIGLGAHIRLKVTDIKIKEKPEKEDSLFVSFKLSNIEILEMLDYKMNQMSETLRKSKITATVQQKSATAVVNKEVEIKKIRIGGSSLFQFLDYEVFDDFVGLKGDLALR